MAVKAGDMNHGRGVQPGACLGALPLVALLTWTLPGCALLQPPPPPPQTTVACDEQEGEILRLQQALAEKEAEVRRLQTQQNVQAKVLKETVGEAARAEVKLRRLATQAGAASQLAEAEVALQAARATHTGRAATQLMQAENILNAGSAAFAQGDYGAAVEFATQAQEIIGMVTGGRRNTQTAVEMPFQVPVALRTRNASNLRAQPWRAATVLTVLPQDTPVQAYAYRGDWLRVRTGDGREGWVHGSLLEAPGAARTEATVNRE
jgi:hypothetical protein